MNISEQLKTLKDMSDRISQMAVELEGLRKKTDLEVDVESLVGKLFRSNTYEAIKVYAVDHIGKYVYAEVVPNCATGRPFLSTEIKRYPGYSLNIKYGAEGKKGEFAQISVPVLQEEPQIYELLGKPFKTPTHTLVFVETIDAEEKLLGVIPVEGIGITSAKVQNLSKVLADNFPEYSFMLKYYNKEDLTFGFDGGVLCLKHRKQ